MTHTPGRNNKHTHTQKVAHNWCKSGSHRNTRQTQTHTDEDGRLLFSPYIFHYITGVLYYPHLSCADIVCTRLCVCVRACTSVTHCVCYRSYSLYTLQVPMQPTGLSGRPLNPSFLLTAKKRYACRQPKHKQTRMHHCLLSISRHFS